MRRFISFLVKAACSALLLYLSLRGVNLRGLVDRISGLDPRWIAFSFVLSAAQTVLLALRWREILLACGAKMSRAKALSYSLIGQFFSQVLPSTVGGDAVRMWLLARAGVAWSTSVYSVLIDRVVGVSVLAVLVVACLPWTFNMIHDPIARSTLAIIGFGVLVGTLAFLAFGIRHFRPVERWWITRHLAAASRAAWQMRTVTVARISTFSFAIHFITAMVAWSAAMAAHASVDYFSALFLVLPVMLIATMPMSIAGWGVRESAMILAFSYSGLANSDGLIISLLIGAINLAIGLIGGIMWIASDLRHSVNSFEPITTVS